MDLGTLRRGYLEVSGSPQEARHEGGSSCHSPASWEESVWLRLIERKKHRGEVDFFPLGDLFALGESIINP